MKEITRENLAEFCPTYLEYPNRIKELAGVIGVTQPDAKKASALPTLLRQLNKQSAIGFDEKELDVLCLVYQDELNNTRYNKYPFFDPKHGGNTAEHPIFMLLKGDDIRDKAGHGPDAFEDTHEQFIAARDWQKIAAHALVHDTCEIVDISYAEMQMLKATKKEPPEEKLIGPFKFTLAAYALATGRKMLYADTLQSIREKLLEEKDRLYQSALSGDISGNDFVDSFGHAIARVLQEEMEVLNEDAGRRHTTVAEMLGGSGYDKAVSSLRAVFDETTESRGFIPTLCKLLDKYQADTHIRHFSGVPAEAPPQDATMLERAFPGHGKLMAHSMGSSAQIRFDTSHAFNLLPQVFEEAAAIKDEQERAVALQIARAAGAAAIRNITRMLQKAPPLIDFGKLDADDHNAMLSGWYDEQQQEFMSRYATQKRLKVEWQDKIKAQGEQRYPVTEITGVMDTKTVIAVMEKLADAVERGEVTPTKGMLERPLPACAQVAQADVVRAAQPDAYPLEVRSWMRHASGIEENQEMIAVRL